MNTAFAPILTEDQQTSERLTSLAGIFQSTDRILTGDAVDVKLEYRPEIEVAAWTDGSTITFNSSQVTQSDSESVELVNGLNFHELAHVMFTPRRGSSLVSWVTDNDHQMAFNILEDQRIETFMTVKYPSTIPWLSAMISRWVMSGGAEEKGYLFVRGRKYLDPRLRGAVRADYERQDLLPEIDSIVDSYRTLVFSRDQEIARGLIERFAAILDETNKDSAPSECPFGHGARPAEIMTSGRPKTSGEQKSLSKKAESIEQEEEEAPADSGDQGDSDEDSRDGSDPVDSNESGTQPGGDSEVQNPHEDRSADSSANDKPTSTQQIAAQVLSEIREDGDVRESIKQIQQRIRSASGSDILDRSKWTLKQPLPVFVRQFWALNKTLNRLVQKADPGWSSRQPSGRINPMRWAQEQDFDTAFDLWDEGFHDVVDMEVVILLDESGSMGQVIDNAVNAMWVMKRSLDRIDASSTVISFDNTSQVLYHRTEKATGQTRYHFSSGGTNPIDALAQAARIFERTRKSQKMLIVLTDGEWSPVEKEGQNANGYITSFNRAGVVTALGFIDDGADHPLARVDGHGCGVKAVVTSETIVAFVSSIVTRAIKQRLVRR